MVKLKWHPNLDSDHMDSALEAEPYESDGEAVRQHLKRVKELMAELTANVKKKEKNKRTTRM
jgi:Arc/MetJ-type ribon-helix-helix transcriptional regulator